MVVELELVFWVGAVTEPRLDHVKRKSRIPLTSDCCVVGAGVQIITVFHPIIIAARRVSLIENERSTGESGHINTYFIHRSTFGSGNIQLLNWSKNGGWHLIEPKMWPLARSSIMVRAIRRSRQSIDVPSHPSIAPNTSTPGYTVARRRAPSPTHR